MFRIPPPYLWTPLSPQRVKGCTPLTIPKMRSKPKNASRFAKRIFLCFSHLRLRRRFHVSAGRYRQQRGNISCEAANRRNEKKALSAATSFFPFRQLLRDYQGRAALDSCLPRLESSGDLAALNTRHLLCKPVCGLKAPLGLSCPAGTAVLSGSLLQPKENIPGGNVFYKRH